MTPLAGTHRREGRGEFIVGGGKGQSVVGLNTWLEDLVFTLHMNHYWLTFETKAMCILYPFLLSMMWARLQLFSDVHSLPLHRFYTLWRLPFRASLTASCGYAAEF